MVGVIPAEAGIQPFSLPWREGVRGRGKHHPHPGPLPSQGEGIAGSPTWIPTFVGMTIEEHCHCEKSFRRRTTKQSPQTAMSHEL